MSADGDANGGEVDVYPNCGIPANILDCYGLDILLGTALQAYELAFLHHLENLLEKDQISRADKIEALELAGAVLLGDDYEPEKFLQDASQVKERTAHRMEHSGRFTAN